MEEPALLLEKQLIKTGIVDHADWNYHGVLGRIQRTRFQMVLSLLNQNMPRRVLEIGYGSGIFMPELFKHCKELYGIDVHDRQDEVKAVLAGLGVEADLSQGSAESLPFPSGFFDCVIAVSSLEFIVDIEKAAMEIRRVMPLDGHLILVTPGHSPMVDFGLRMLTGESAEKDYGSRRQALLPALGAHFKEESCLTFPPHSGGQCLYQALQLGPSR